MRLKIDRDANAVYLRLDESALVESEEAQPGVILDFDSENPVVGVEILGIRDRVPEAMLRTMQVETT